MERKLDFSNVLIKPKFTQLKSRSEVNLSRTFTFRCGETLTSLPIMAANMDTVGTMEVFKTLKKYNMITIFHKFLNETEIMENKTLLEENKDLFAFSLGFSEKEFENLKILSENIDFKIICIDVANGYMSDFVVFCKKVRNFFKDKIIIAGNVVTPEMCERLIVEGEVDIVKVGIGGGSACTTRVKTGVGYPQLSSVLECKNICHSYNAFLISDGGITCPGDLGKALGAGADFAMIGGQFAGHVQNPGELIEEDGKQFKLFYGMSSSHAMKKNYLNMKNYRTSEGRVLKIPFRGDLNETVSDFLGGLRSTCTYVNCKEIQNLSNCVNFVLVSSQFNSSLL